MDGNSFRSNLWNEANCDGSSIAYVLYINSHAQINGRWLVAPLSKGLRACRAYTGKLLHKVPGRVSSDGAEMREVQCWSSHQSLSRVLSSLSQQSTCLGECHQCVKVGWFNHGKEKETFCESIDSRVSQVQVLLEGLMFLLWTTKLVVDWSYRDLCRFVHEILKSPFAIPWGMMIWHEALNSLHNVSRLWSRSWSVNKYSKATTTETRSLRTKTETAQMKLRSFLWNVKSWLIKADFASVSGCKEVRKMQLPRVPHPNCRCFALVLESSYQVRCQSCCFGAVYISEFWRYEMIWEVHVNFNSMLDIESHWNHGLMTNFMIGEKWWGAP